MAEEYVSVHTGQEIDSAVSKALNPSTTFTSEDAGKLADAEAVGKLVNTEKERAEATYLPYDGYSQLARVGEADVADNLTPYSEDSGTAQENPFILQGSGCANGEEQADTGSYCQLQRKNGNTVTVNQAAKAINSTNWQAESGVTATFNNGEAVFSSDTVNYGIRCSTGVNIIKEHKYFMSFDGYALSPLALKMYYGGGGGASAFTAVLTSSMAHYCAIVTNALGIAGTLYFFPTEEAGLNVEVHIKNPLVIDLTFWFGSNDKIPTHLLNHPEDFFRYYQGSLAYNAGTLTDCNGQYLKTVGRQQWDEQWELGAIATATGEPYSSSTSIRSKNFCRCIPNTDYFVKGTTAIYWYDANENFIKYETVNNGVYTSPANAIFFKFGFFNSYGITYNHDITISLYYDGESGYDQYYPYEELANVDTGSETLLAFDWKEPNGTIHRNTVRVDLGSLEWTYTTHQVFGSYFFVNIADAKRPTDSEIYATGQNAICARYANTIRTALAFVDKTFVIDDAISAAQIQVKDSAYSTAEAFKTAMSGVYLEYELADAYKTTEQGTPFPENVAIDDFGTMVFDCPNGVPQGNLIFYPVDYKAEFDTLHNITDGDMHKIALKGDDLAPTDPETLKGAVDYTTEVKTALGGTLRQVLCLKESLDFLGTDYVDLSTIAWSYHSGSGVFYATFTSMAVSAKIVCSKYKTSSSLYTALVNGEISTNSQGFSSNAYIFIKDTAYTDPALLQASLKGVLMAYEKAST